MNTNKKWFKKGDVIVYDWLDGIQTAKILTVFKDGRIKVEDEKNKETHILWNAIVFYSRKELLESELREAQKDCNYYTEKIKEIQSELNHSGTGG